MSSTARGGQRSPADFYATPSWAVHRLLERITLPGGHWHECAAGDGAIIRAVNSFRQERRLDSVIWSATELREECGSFLAPLATTEIMSFFDVPVCKSDVLITNPPFNLAHEFIGHSLKFSPIVIHLLRLNFLGTAERNPFFQSNMPDVFVVPDRISFTADGKADSIEYAWFCWRERGRRRGYVEVLDTTPVEVRRHRRQRYSQHDEVSVR